MAAEPQLISVSQYELFRDDFNSIDVAQAGTIDSCQMAQLLEKQLGYKLSPAQASSLITGIERDRRGNTTLVGYLNMLLGAGWKVPMLCAVLTFIDVMRSIAGRVGGRCCIPGPCTTKCIGASRVCCVEGHRIGRAL